MAMYTGTEMMYCSNHSAIALNQSDIKTVYSFEFIVSSLQFLVGVTNTRLWIGSDSKLETINSKLGLFRGSKNGGSVVSDANRHASVMSEARQPFDAGKIKTQTRSANLHSQAGFCLGLGSQRTIPRSCIRPAVNFAGDAELLVDTKDARGAVSDYIVLRKQLSRRCQNCNAKVTESVQSSVTAKLFANQDGTESVGLVDADPASLVGVRELDAETKAQ